tara:strand:- start:4398 stop:4877 length:480 start_codon:yes stop_codon:yes gene_type:complete
MCTIQQSYQPHEASWNHWESNGMFAPSCYPWYAQKLSQFTTLLDNSTQSSAIDFFSMREFFNGRLSSLVQALPEVSKSAKVFLRFREFFGSGEEKYCESEISQIKDYPSLYGVQHGDTDTFYNDLGASDSTTLICEVQCNLLCPLGFRNLANAAVCEKC